MFRFYLFYLQKVQNDRASAALNALAAGLQVSEECGRDVREAVGAVSGVPGVWHGVERRVGDDAIK